MKFSSNSLHRILLRMIARFRASRLAESYKGDEAPLRSELLSIEQMKQHGQALAHSHKLSPAPDSNQLLSRLNENERILIGACDLVTTAVKANRRIAPAAEWLLDNFYLIEEQIQTAKRHFPKGYSRELPRLLDGPSAGLPRVYDIALEIISHGDGRIDPENLSSFVAAYQTVTALRLGELWAIPIMLRLALIENLRRIGARIAAVRTDQDRAANWSDQMLEIVEKDPKNLILVIADMARSNPPMVSSFVAELTRRLQGQSPTLMLPISWVEQRLSESGLTIEQLVQAGNRQEASDQVSISNSIGSLRFLGAMDWREFVEKMSVVEQALRGDPGSFYVRMDFATRDRYRHAVEKIAKNSEWSEREVALRAIEMAREGGGKNSEERAGHVGFYLIDRGLPELEKTLEVRRSSVETLQRVIRRFPVLIYLAAITLMSGIFTGGLLVKIHEGGTEGWILAPLAVLFLLCTSHLAVPLVNWLASLLAAPQLLPRMDFSGGIPPESRTLVVVPTILTSVQNVEELVESLEVRFLANRSENLHFALLTDFRDARQETIPEDEPLLQLARERIKGLNQKYSDSNNDTFFLFHRPRRWNPQEATWMGYERKRGKLADLNSLLLGGLLGTSGEQFSVIVGHPDILLSIKYVITLDTDTQLPRDSAWQFVGTMAHPLNRPRYDGEKGRVCEGYGILQPRVAVSLPGTNRSRFARLFGSEPGIDPYTRTVSDVYQDLFHEGSFIGKGIYEVDAFEKALKDRFPENRILSHDLVEGCYARAGLLSDVQVYEEYPSNYSADVNRRHRWIRGDWQIARWLLPGVPGRETDRQRNPLSGLSRWKIFDNLRRSLVPSAMVSLLLLGWTALSPKWLWTLAVLAILLLQPCIAAVVDLFRKPKDLLMSRHFAITMQSLGRHMAQAVFTLACLPHEAYFSLDAIVRTAWRIWFTHTRLLEWNPSTSSDHSLGTDFSYYSRIMWIAPVLVVVMVICLAFSMPTAIGAALPFLSLWFISPAIAWWISRPLPGPIVRLTSEQTFFLRKLSRKTWAFYEAFVGPKDHWLPPDNYQEHPVAIIGHRTSPTNIGLALLANFSAYDFGYIQTGELIDRTANTFQTMESLERSRGHFYNWYDTETLNPLHPRYISSVDSGNLAGHLLTLRSGLLLLLDQKILGTRWLEGLSDTLLVLVDLRERLERGALDPLVQFQKDLAAVFDSSPTTLVATWKCLDRLADSSAKVADSIDAVSRASENEVTGWARALARQSRGALDELTFLAPWIRLPTTPSRFHDLAGIDEIPTLRQLAELDIGLLPEIDQRLGPDLTSGERHWLIEFRRSVKESSQRARARISDIKRLALQSGEFAQFEYDFLFDKASHLLTIGYNASERHRDSSFYDLLASEARLSTFVGIAQGKLPQESWFSLGRLLTTISGEPVLLSWSGSMFEYLMPLLVMPSYENTLLDLTYKTAVQSQIAYGRKRGVPWGMSESGYNAIDIRLNYQYRAFGVPGLGLKRGLADDLVVAPYASVLALMISPEEACLNLQRLAEEGLEGRYGLYEAIDYTPSRIPRGQSKVIVRSFMAHHQGMSFLSLAYLLLDHPMQKRFESDPSFQATMLLLQERVPKISTFWHATEHAEIRTAVTGPETRVRVFNTPDTPIPEVQLLSNGRYHVMITNAGGGYSRWKNLAVTRWREDTTCDNWGTFCYIRDVESGEFWSTAYQPTLKRSENYETIFSEARAEFRCRYHEFDTHTQIAVSPEDDIELRQVILTNRALTRRVIEVTSYAEVVIAPSAADALHPAFNNLFVQTEILHSKRAVLCTRRPRSREEQPPWMFHLMGVHGVDTGDISYETDRMKFIGRGNTVVNPAAMQDASDVPGTLSGTEGSVLDPIVAIRYRIILDPGESATINMVSGAGESRDICMGLINKYQDRRLADRVFDLAWTHGRVLLQQINATEADAQLYTHLAASVIYANASLRADAGTLARNRRGQSGLWGYSISGDLPIVLLRIGDQANIELVRQLVQTHAYWRLKGLMVDLVIWNEDHEGYRQLLHEQIVGLVTAGLEANLIDRPGGIFIRATDQISNEDRLLLQSVARCIITDGRGTLWDQVHRRRLTEVLVPHFTPTRPRHRELPAVAALPRRDLIFFNGLGGFTPDGREYVISTAEKQRTPAPWVNVLANPCFGTILSESGAACTWNENAHEFRLTPWTNDSVSETSGEAFYIRDDESGDFWSPTPLPSGGPMPYASRHGFGYSVFEHTERGIRSELWVYVAIDAPIKFALLKIRNESGRFRRLSVTGYVEWVLGDLRPKWAMHVITEVEAGSGAFFARNRYNTEFADRIAFFDVDDAVRNVTGDRTEFLGRNGTQRSPAAMTRVGLSGRVGSALDPCAAIQIPFELADGQEREIVFRLGVGRDASNAINMVNRFRGSAAAQAVLETVWRYWNRTLGAVQIDTPDLSLNVLANGWLLYQTLACRLWARNAFYQPGGAFGFRDQLQDVMALIHAEPQLAREHLLLCATRQFREGDVQHWWHPPSGRGVRTHCSDDYLWLPLATSRYVLSSGDTGILDESVPFIQGRPVNEKEDSYYDLPDPSEESATLYEHCVRAIHRALKFGEHGLPLMGSGDWNDGMNRVGEQGKGESVWLGFFLYKVLMRFMKIALLRGDIPFARRCEDETAKLRENIEQHGWDGEWYLRAYFDDGSPLGSSTNLECQIDSIAQSWSVLSGAADPERARRAMESLGQRLVRRDDQLIQLLAPAFDKSDLNPGYIKGYVPGIRENGGQYTQAAIWAATAFAALGDSERAWELLAMINPVNHAGSPESNSVYKVEPYVVSADIYALPPHTGRGGWTWYTGSAGWMYRLILESLLGLRLKAAKLRFAPCLPVDWERVRVHYRYRETIYHVTVLQGDRNEGGSLVTVDGNEQHENAISLVDDRMEHIVEVRIPFGRCRSELRPRDFADRTQADS